MPLGMKTNNETPTCCFCCHVKVGTFVLAILFLIGGIFNIILSSLLLSNTLQYEDYGGDDLFMDDVSNYNRSALWFVLVNGIFLILIALMAIYGVTKNRAGYLLPLFIVQIFDFLCTIVTIGSLMFYWPTVKYNILTCRHMPEEWKEWLLSLDDRWLAVLLFSALFLCLFIRSYLLSMVYRCYKFITTQAVLLRHRNDPEISSVSTMDEGKKPIYSPPKYEDIQKVPLVDDAEEIDTKPPPYVS